ncbi:MAG: alpha/beta hydrolase [Ruminococcaceae bacterium]|nr:alpha/beta hydrolase [Oscillospiraceae bacterium]
MEKSIGKILSSNGKDELTYYIYEPKSAPRAIIQISHGMCEYVERYEGHAEYFCSQGFIFAGHDHLGHKNSAASDDELGYTCSADALIDDLAKMTDLLREKFPNLPVFVLGHSMGSFVLRAYIEKYPKKANAAIISGTAGPGSPAGIAKILAKLIGKAKGDHYRSPLLRSLSTGNYYKAFGKNAPREAWLTRDTSVTEKYKNDKFCKFTFSANGYYNLFDLLGRISRNAWAKTVDPDLPILLISGDQDPVGNFGKGVKKVHARLADAGIKDLTLKLFAGARHEPFNEIEPTRAEAYKTVTDWINERI